MGQIIESMVFVCLSVKLWLTYCVEGFFCKHVHVIASSHLRDRSFLMSPCRGCLDMHATYILCVVFVRLLMADVKYITYHPPNIDIPVTLMRFAVI